MAASSFKALAEEMVGSDNGGFGVVEGPGYILFVGWEFKLSPVRLNRFVFKGVSYPTIAHFVFASKAERYAGAKEVAAVLGEKNGWSCGRMIKDMAFDRKDWSSEAVNVVRRAYTLLFIQRPGLKKILLETGEKRIIYASFDMHLGSGLSLAETKAGLETNKGSLNFFPGANIVGETLCYLRRLMCSDLEK